MGACPGRADVTDKPSKPISGTAEPAERWGSWEDAEYWRKESFLARTPAQRMKWLEEMAALAKRAKALAAEHESGKAP